MRGHCGGVKIQTGRQEEDELGNQAVGLEKRFRKRLNKAWRAIGVILEQ